MEQFDPGRLTSFIHELQWTEVPQDVRAGAQRSLLDLLGALAAGSATPLATMVQRFAAAEFVGDEAAVPFTHLRSTASGAALATGMTIDAMDSHDGHRLAKGHAGAGVLSAALACAELHEWRGDEFMSGLVMGYEVALRAALALHETAGDYHSSGAWVSLGAAAVAARATELSPAATRHALGIAEYHGPRSPMMRCIDHPSMLKDGAGWGSMAGMHASRLAEAGFTGAPAALVEQDRVAQLWVDLGSRWRMRELYLKPYACCRWAQPAIHAALLLQSEHDIAPDDIHRLWVHTFEAATRLKISRPENTEEAQYSLPYPVAAAIIAGKLGPEQVREPFILNEQVLDLAGKVHMIEDAGLEAQFPPQALARVEVELGDGRKLASPATAAPGGREQPLNEEEVREKFLQYANPVLGRERSGGLLRAVAGLPEAESVSSLVMLLTGRVRRA